MKPNSVDLIFADPMNATGGSLGAINDTAIFGYQEAWAEYRYKQNRVTGQFRSNATGTLDSWHYADYYSERPYLSDDWVRETPVNIDRTLAVGHSVADQFLAEFYFKNLGGGKDVSKKVQFQSTREYLDTKKRFV